MKKGLSGFEILLLAAAGYWLIKNMAPAPPAFVPQPYTGPIYGPPNPANDPCNQNSASYDSIACANQGRSEYAA